MGGADFFSAEVATSTLTFSRDCPSFPRRTIQYESYFSQGSGFDSNPGSTHAAAQARAALAAWREGSWEPLRAALEEQCAFDRDYLAGWLPDYAAGLCRMKMAHLYPQLAKGLAAFAQLDRDFCANGLARVGRRSPRGRAPCLAAVRGAAGIRGTPARHTPERPGGERAAPGEIAQGCNRRCDPAVSLRSVDQGAWAYLHTRRLCVYMRSRHLHP